MLTLYRRHKPTCPHFAEGRRYHHCKCRIWVDGILGGKEIRRSLGTRDWTKANREVQKWEAAERVSEQEAPVMLADAWDKLLADLEARKLSESTIGKYKLLRRQMTAYGEPRSLTHVAAFDLDTLSQFRATWKDGPRTASKKLERLRAFFRFAQKRKWVLDNPASDLRAPRAYLCPTMPFTRDEMLRILAAMDKYKCEFPNRGAENARRIRALVLLLRYSGMRIGDAVSLTSDRIEGSRLFLYTQKTGVAVNTVLPEFVLKALDATPRVTEKHFFWDGTSNLETIVGSWRKRLVKLFDLAKVSGGHAHRFRDTFAVELLLSGVPIERVSVLLGHQSVRITEKHYSPWVRSRQEQLEADVRNAWSNDPLIIEGTKRVQIQ
jgi:integrase/recombinase XerD